MIDRRMNRAVLFGAFLLATSSPLVSGARAEAQDTEVSAAPQARTDEGRLRYGGAVATGFGFVSDTLTWNFDAHGRIGAQLNDYFALYYQPSLLFGVTVVNVCFGTNPCGSQLFVLHTSAAVAELTVADGLQMAAGPSFVAGGGDAGAVAGLGITGRIGWTFGGMGTGARQGFSIAVHPNGGWFLTDGGGGFWDITIALGWDSF